MSIGRLALDAKLSSAVYVGENQFVLMLIEKVLFVFLFLVSTVIPNGNKIKL